MEPVPSYFPSAEVDKTWSLKWQYCIHNGQVVASSNYNAIISAGGFIVQFHMQKEVATSKRNKRSTIVMIYSTKSNYTSQVTQSHIEKTKQIFRIIFKQTGSCSDPRLCTSLLGKAPKLPPQMMDQSQSLYPPLSPSSSDISPTTDSMEN